MSVGDLTGFRRQEEAIAANRIDDAIKRKMRYEDLNRALKGRIISIVQSDPEYYKQLAAETDDNVLDLIISGGALGGDDLAKFMSVRQKPLKFGSPETAYSSMSSKITPYSSDNPQDRSLKFAEAIIGKTITPTQKDIEARQSEVVKGDNAVEDVRTELGTGGTQLDKMIENIANIRAAAYKRGGGYSASEETSLDVKPGKPTLVQTIAQESNPYFEGVEDRDYKDLEKLSLLEESNKILTGVSGGNNVYDDARKQRIIDFTNYVATINKPKIVEEQKIVQQGTEGSAKYTRKPYLSETANSSTNISTVVNSGDGGMKPSKTDYGNPDFQNETSQIWEDPYGNIWNKRFNIPTGITNSIFAKAGTLDGKTIKKDKKGQIIGSNEITKHLKQNYKNLGYAESDVNKIKYNETDKRWEGMPDGLKVQYKGEINVPGKGDVSKFDITAPEGHTVNTGTLNALGIQKK